MDTNYNREIVFSKVCLQWLRTSVCARLLIIRRAVVIIFFILSFIINFFVTVHSFRPSAPTPVLSYFGMFNFVSDK